MIQAVGESDDLRALGRDGPVTIGPADGGRDIDRGNERFLGRRQLRIRPGSILDEQLCFAAATG